MDEDAGSTKGRKQKTKQSDKPPMVSRLGTGDLGHPRSHRLRLHAGVTRCGRAPCATWAALHLDDDRNDHRAAPHLLVEELAQRVADRVLQHLPFRITAARLV